MSGSTTVGRRVELYVRSLAPTGSRRCQVGLIDRLGDLEGANQISEYSVHVWGRQAPPTREETRTPTGEAVHERLATFREWAERNGVSLDPAVESRSVESAIRGCEHRSTVLPTVLLAEYEGTDLVCVTPHRDEGRVRTVPDRLDDIADGTAQSHAGVEFEDPRVLREPRPVGE